MKRAEAGEQNVKAVIEAMSYQISKEIAMHGATLCGRVDRVIITGGMAHQEEFIASIEKRVSYLAPVTVIPGEMEMYALAERAREALTGRTEVKEY
jgi:butyrate kinase